MNIPKTARTLRRGGANTRNPMLRTMAVIAAVMCLGVVVTACSNDEPAVNLNLSAEGKKGQTVAGDKGCRGCHGLDGEGGVGPKWIGLYGSKVTLEDGTTITADDEYIKRAITDPTAEAVKGSTMAMPKVKLTDAEVDSLVAFIKDLAK